MVDPRINSLRQFLEDEAAEIDAMAADEACRQAAKEGLDPGSLVAPVRTTVIEAHRDAPGPTKLTEKATRFGLQPQHQFASADLSHLSLRQERFAKADLRASDLNHSDLTGADLEEARLDRADLSHSILRDANLRRANLTGAKLDEADVAGADFTGADLSGVDLKSFASDEAIGIGPGVSKEDELFLGALKHAGLAPETFATANGLIKELSAERARLRRTRQHAEIAQLCELIGFAKWKLGRLGEARQMFEESKLMLEKTDDNAGIERISAVLDAICAAIALSPDPKPPS